MVLGQLHAGIDPHKTTNCAAHQFRVMARVRSSVRYRVKVRFMGRSRVGLILGLAIGSIVYMWINRCV